MKEVLSKIKNGFIRYGTFGLACRYFYNGRSDLVVTNIGLKKYFVGLVICYLLGIVIVFTGTTNLPDGTAVSMPIIYTNWTIFAAAYMALMAVFTRGTQSMLMPMSHRRRTVYYLLHPIVSTVILIVCLAVLLYVVIAIAMLIMYSPDAISQDGAMLEEPVYSPCPSAVLWCCALALLSFSVALLIGALNKKQGGAAKWGKNKFIALIAGYKRQLCALISLILYYVFCLLVCNLSEFKHGNGPKLFANPVIALGYMPLWQGWLFAGLLTVVAVAMCSLAIIFTYRECKPKAF